MLNVHFTDDSLKTFIVDDDLTVHELLTAISTTLKVKSIETYSLYDVSTISDPVCLDRKLKIMDVLTAWQKKVKLRNGTFGTPRHNMVFSKRLYTNRLGNLARDPVETHLLYTQAKGCVLRGKYAVTDTEALLLAALTLQVRHRLLW